MCLVVNLFYDITIAFDLLNVLIRGILLVGECGSRVGEGAIASDDGDSSKRWDGN